MDPVSEALEGRDALRRRPHHRRRDPGGPSTRGVEPEQYRNMACAEQRGDGKAVFATHQERFTVPTDVDGEFEE
ncbi:hypothetical protein QA600_13675 [Natronococcus sp. A-GB1]|uniref:hypothetical protein n=1 Tax=Natronococcus sp. A-GB1 TaxID=3037648 RepID=UPI00241D0F91|nr:hypothetical protein [Natronococcus sp. A-GB1]MDG5760386.1 hypothetical protein [Natronococcus sp. A-GB1]